MPWPSAPDLLRRNEAAGVVPVIAIESTGRAVPFVETLLARCLSASRVANATRAADVPATIRVPWP